MTRTLLTISVALLTGLAVAGAVQAAPINGVLFNERVFNDFPSSIIATTNNFPTLVAINDSNLNGPPGFANRTDAVMSSDGGVTAKTFGILEGFDISANVTLTDSSNTPRKEAGIRINSPVTGDALFLVNSDAGEIVAFGGPFFSFGSNGSGNGYTPGQSIFMREIYRPGTPGTMEFIINRGMGLESSGLLPWTNLEGGPVNYQVAFYEQGGSNTQGGFVDAQFQSIRVPEPTSLGLAGLAAVMGVVFLRAFRTRRRV